MMKFTRMLPTLLTQTDVVLELRDSRLPLTSINRTLEGQDDGYLLESCGSSMWIRGRLVLRAGFLIGSTVIGIDIEQKLSSSFC